jgi:hypothetical protein
MNNSEAAKLIPGACVANGHLMLPACLAADEPLARSMIAAGQAAMVGAEVRRREQAKKDVGWYAPAVDLSSLAHASDPADSVARQTAIEQILSTESRSTLARTIRDVRRMYPGCTAHPRFNAQLSARMT